MDRGLVGLMLVALINNALGVVVGFILLLQGRFLLGGIFVALGILGVIYGRICLKEEIDR